MHKSTRALLETVPVLPSVGTISFALMSLAAVPAAAIEVDGYEATPEKEKNEGELTLELDFEPNVTGDFSKPRGDRLSDLENTAKATLEYKVDIADNLQLKTSLGASWATDFETGDEDHESSSIFAGGKINLDRGFRHFSPYVAYKIEYQTDNFFGAHDSTDHTVELGADFVFYDRKVCEDRPGTGKGSCRKGWGYKLLLVPSFERVWSSDPLNNNRLAPRIKAKLEVPIANGVNFTSAVDYQYRMFDEILDGRDDQHRFRASSAVDIAKFVKIEKLTSLRFGATWSYVSQPGDDNDTSEISFTPGLTLSFKLE